MGCFSSSQPTYSPPTPPKLPTAEELYNQSQSFWNTNYPELANAQTNALKNVNNPDYYSTFQPTSMESALQQKNFQNVWPDTEAYMKNILSQSGMAYSPTAAATLGKQYGNMQTQIGQYLTDLGNTRATNAINAGLGISTSSLLQPYVSTGQQQSTNQANLDYQYQQALAQQQYQQAMNEYQQNQAFAQMLGQVSPVAGNVYNATQGNLGTGLAGTMKDVQTMIPMMSLGSGGLFGNLFNGSNTGSTNSGNGVNFANNYQGSGIGNHLGSGQYNGGMTQPVY
jgi:hypothetical protein